MKKYLLVSFALLVYCSSFSQTKDYRVVFDISSGDSASQQAVVREVEIIKNSSPEAKIEVVVYGKGLSLVLKEKSGYSDQIKKLLGMPDVAFRVCSITMKRNNTDASQLLPGIEPVPDGIYELVSKQREGWGYIKVAH